MHNVKISVNETCKGIKIDSWGKCMRMLFLEELVEHERPSYDMMKNDYVNSYLI